MGTREIQYILVGTRVVTRGYALGTRERNTIWALVALKLSNLENLYLYPE